MLSIYKKLFFLISMSLAFTSIQISGHVKDVNGDPLSNVNVIVSNTSVGTMTSTEGSFVFDLDINDNCELQVSHIGYQKYYKKFDCDQDTYFSIELLKTSVSFEETVIVGTRTEAYVKDSPVLTHVISNQDVKESVSYNIKGILKQAMPNMQIVPSNHTGDRLKMQALDNKYMLFLIDGDKMTGEYAGNIDLSVINVNNIERIEIVESSLSTLYGSNAIGGVVNIISKKNKDKFWINNIISQDDILGDNKSLSFGGNSNKLSYNINYSNQKFSGYDLTPTTIDPFDYTLKSYDKRYYKYSMDYNYDRNSNLNLSLQSYNSFIKDYDDAIDNSTNMQVKIYSDLLKKYKDDIYKIKFDKTLTRNSSIKFSMMYENYQKINFYPYYYNSNQFDLDANPEEFVGGELEHGNVYLQYNRNSKNHNVVIGVEKVFDNYYSYNIYDNNGNISSPSIFEGLDQSKKYIENSVFLHDQIHFSNNTEIYYGLRYTNAMNFSDKTILAMSIINKHPSGYNVRLNVSSGYRIPSLKELYYEYPAHFIPLYGNPNLRPTLSKNYSLSFDKRTIENDFSIDFYIRDIENFISTEYENAALVYKNYDYVLINGFNVNYRRKINKESSVKFVYNYVGIDSEENEILELISNHSLFIKYKYLFSSNFSFLANVSYSGEKFNFSQEDDYVGLPAITILDPFWISDFIFSYNYKDKFNLKFGIKNVFDYKDPRKELGDDLLNSYDPGKRLYFEINMNYRKE